MRTGTPAHYEQTVRSSRTLRVGPTSEHPAGGRRGHGGTATQKEHSSKSSNTFANPRFLSEIPAPPQHPLNIP